MLNNVIGRICNRVGPTKAIINQLCQGFQYTEENKEKKERERQISCEIFTVNNLFKKYITINLSYKLFISNILKCDFYRKYFLKEWSYTIICSNEEKAKLICPFADNKLKRKAQ